MRPNQQNKNRSRGRNGNNNGGRKHINPLSRNYESNGPDVKVRGNAAHIAEKYVQLARDAQASGDSVMAENYFQHAEHYFRIVSAAQPQGVPRSDFYPGDGDMEDEEFDEAGVPDGLEQHARIPDEQPAIRQDRPVRDPREPRESRQPREDQSVEATASATTVESPVDAQPAEAASGDAEEGEVRRVRRTRRPRRVAETAGDPAAAPQPEVGELPAFITVGGTTNAAE